MNSLPSIACATTGGGRAQASPDAASVAPKAPAPPVKVVAVPALASVVVRDKGKGKAAAMPKAQVARARIVAPRDNARSEGRIRHAANRLALAGPGASRG